MNNNNDSTLDQNLKALDKIESSYVWYSALFLQLPIQMWVGFYIEWHYFTFLTCFVLIPIIDNLLGEDLHRPQKYHKTALSEPIVFQGLLWLWIPIQTGFMIWGCWVLTQSNLNIFEQIAFFATLSLLTGSGIIIAHELGHHSHQANQVFAKYLLSTVGYLHFFVEHNRGHHQRVATLNDPATARYGESFYQFLPRTVLGSWQSACQFEEERLKQKKLPILHWKNQMIWSGILPLGYAWGFGLWLGWSGVVIYGLQCTGAIFYLELVNYIEHYGLLRKEIEGGKYEKITERHSWDANQWLFNRYMFRLGRHADHHLHPVRNYPRLEVHYTAPQMPFGYPMMTAIALIPPLWFRLMNARVPTEMIARNELR